MRLLLANPNSTEAITEACLVLARAAASPGTEIVPWTNRQGPPVIDSLYGDYMAGRPLLQGLLAVQPPPDVVLLAGFGNYGTGAVKEVLSVPVIGMAEAAMAFSVPLCHRFAIVTTSARMVPYTEDVVQLFGFGSHCAAVRAVDLPPLAAEPPPFEEVVAELAEQVAGAEGTVGADLVILGGSRLSPYAAALQGRTELPIIEPVACGVQMAETLVRLGLRQSKVRKFAPPPQPLGAYDPGSNP